eukprot:m.338390 g.338390  ORF g.338390 m.338390 type:complete len:361 (+) comp18402_c0_seq1:159-1241(+)
MIDRQNGTMAVLVCGVFLTAILIGMSVTARTLPDSEAPVQRRQETEDVQRMFTNDNTDEKPGLDLAEVSQNIEEEVKNTDSTPNQDSENDIEGNERALLKVTDRIITETQDDATAANPEEPPIERKYEFEEMFVEHPILGNKGDLRTKTMKARVKSVYIVHAKPAAGIERKQIAILLLHGAKFSAATWDQTNTIEALVQEGFDVYAMDLPGYGRSEGKVDSALREAFLKGIINKMGLSKPIIVSPSMSGSFSVPLVLTDPSLISGFVSVAAVWTKKLEGVNWGMIDVYALHIYGDLDTEIGAVGAAIFEKSKGPPEKKPQVFVMKNAHHPCYIDNPKAFNKRLIRFALRVEGKRSNTKLG